MQLEVWKKPKQESSRGEASGSRGGEGGGGRALYVYVALGACPSVSTSLGMTVT